MFGASNMLPHSMPHMSLCCRLRCCFQPARSTVFIAVTMAVRPGVPLVCLGLRRFCVAGVGQLLLRGRRGTMCTAKGSDVRPGVPLASLGLRLFCVAGVGQCALPSTHTHTCSEVSYRITDMECITRAQTLQLNLTGMVE